MAHQLSARALYSSDTYKYNSSSSFPITVTSSSSSSSKPLRFSKKTRQPNSRVSTSKTGSLESGHKTQKLNLEVSPHRAVSAVRLMRIELGGAFADLLNEKGKGSGDNEMGYVERTLGFRTRDLDDRDLRLVTDIVGGTIRWRRYLDYLILSFCHDAKTFSGMEPLLLQILRIGFYEIVKLDMPPYAVVDEEFCIDSADRYVPPEFVTEQGFFFSSPVKHSLDGAFAARLLRL